MLMSGQQIFQNLNQSITARMIRIVLGVSLVIFIGACASRGYSVADVSQADPVQNSDYRIGPGDALQIFVWDHQDLSIGVQVRPDGKISTPLVEDLQAAGQTPTELARDIELVLLEYVRSPVVTVIMQGFVGEGQQQIRVVGQAVTPKALQFWQGMTVLDVMIEVGGLSEFAAGNRSKIIRKWNGEQIEIRVRLNDLLNNGRVEQNVHMIPGDVLVIPASWF